VITQRCLPAAGQKLVYEDKEDKVLNN